MKKTGGIDFMKLKWLVLSLTFIFLGGDLCLGKNATGAKNPDQRITYPRGTAEEAKEREEFLKKIPTPKEWWAENRERDKRDKPDEIIDSLSIDPGMIVGEAGAGDGYFTLFLSRAVGGKGTVYANDNDRFMLYALEYYMTACQHDKNIIPVLGSDTDPLFPADELDMIVIYGSFHDFQDRKGWLNTAKNYLKPHGILAIVDGYWPDHGGLTYELITGIAQECGFKQISYKDFSSSSLSHHLHIFLRGQ